MTSSQVSCHTNRPSAQRAARLAASSAMRLTFSLAWKAKPSRKTATRSAGPSVRSRRKSGSLGTEVFNRTWSRMRQRVAASPRVKRSSCSTPPWPALAATDPSSSSLRPQVMRVRTNRSSSSLSTSWSMRTPERVSTASTAQSLRISSRSSFAMRSETCGCSLLDTKGRRQRWQGVRCSSSGRGSPVALSARGSGRGAAPRRPPGAPGSRCRRASNRAGRGTVVAVPDCRRACCR